MMAPFPLPLTELLGHWGSYVVYLIVGFAFGYVLEIAGFGNSKKLAAQFYFKEMTVLKVMFSAIVVAMVLIFLASGLGLLDYNLIWVNPTYLWPGIVGGLIMGVGFIVGGFCPGTSLVAAATLKLDGIFFVLGVFFGIFLFGETVGGFSEFWNSSNMGRYTLPEWLGLPTGTVVLLVVLMALFMFWGAEKLEQYFGGKEAADEPKWRIGAGGGLALAAVGLIFIGQPTTLDRWNRIADEKTAVLEERAVQVHPGEMLEHVHDPNIKAVLLDVRSEADYNQFHILDAEHVPLAELPERIPMLHMEAANTVFFVMSNDETAATAAWKTLQAESVPNVYILEGGVNNWLSLFANDEFLAVNPPVERGDDQLAFAFPAALGDRQFPAEPDPHKYEFAYVPKVVLELKRAPASGGCG
ncbi:YeeE/YedE thiosulfate transporter family protein [Candidatus Leptofilum sp.]|uniref:YeeE/YedE thiosulfate transporter family protein n=1 Tax=Candidatus Leptofilum sp. TaxID=3241576 RepID=UPI003B5BA115